MMPGTGRFEFPGSYNAALWGGRTAGERGGETCPCPPDLHDRKYYRITRRGLMEVGNRARKTPISTKKPELMPGTGRFEFPGLHNAALWGGRTAGERGVKPTVSVTYV